MKLTRNALPEKEGDLGPVYGYLWRSFGGRYPEHDGVDQIARLVGEIKNNPNSPTAYRDGLGSARSR